jgi:hypothetical protein
MTNIINQMVLIDSFTANANVSALVNWATSAADFKTFKSKVSAPPAVAPANCSITGVKENSVIIADVIRVSLHVDRAGDKTIAKLFPPATPGQQPVFQDSDLLPLDFTDDQGRRIAKFRLRKSA